MAQISKQLDATVIFSPEEIAAFPQGPQGIPGPVGPVGPIGPPGDCGSLGASAQFVDPAGSDGDNGLSLATAKQTLAAAYAALPASGGSLLLAPGAYDVAAGLVCTPGKPVEVRALVPTSGRSASVDPYEARIYTSSGPVIDALISVPVSAAGNGYGFGFYGVTFDLGVNANFGFHGVNVSKAYFVGCTGRGSESAPNEQFLGRSEIASPGNDASWWRFDRNHARRMGLHKAGNFGNTTGTNCNQHVWAHNIVLLGPRAQAMIDIWEGNRCVSIANNLEDGIAGAYAIRAERTHLCMFLGDGGEGTPIFIRLTGTTLNHSNILMPLGVALNYAGKKLVDDDNPKRNRNLSDFIGWQLAYAERRPVTAVKTGNYTANVWDRVIPCNTNGGGFTVTFPATGDDAFQEVHTITNHGTSGAVTVTAGNTINGATTVPAGVSRTYWSNGTSWFQA